MGPFNTLLFAGGPCSERGFVLNQLRPRDAQGNSLGGNSRLTDSLELRFPNGRRPLERPLPPMASAVRQGPWRFPPVQAEDDGASD
jgi:outer membrane protein assembly factor BamA